jgi:hypothetical protein
MDQITNPDHRCYAQLLRYNMNNIPLAPKAFSGTIDNLYTEHITNVCISAKVVTALHRKLIEYLSSDDPIYLVRNVRGTTRGETIRTQSGHLLRATDNSPGWYMHHELFNNNVERFTYFAAFIDTIPCHMFNIRLQQTVNSAGWHVAHLFEVKDRNISFNEWDRKELKRRMIRNLHPCNIFYIPKTDWQIHGGAKEILAYVYQKYSELYSVVWDEFLEAAEATPIELSTEANQYFINIAATSPQKELPQAYTDLLKPKTIAATYTFSRLCFKRDIIEPLSDYDFFSVIIPDGRFTMSKVQFYETFDNVVRSKSYQQDGIFHYPTPPKKSLIFYFPD